MNTILKEDFATLAKHSSDVCISIYIPSHQSGVEVNEGHDLIRFKNALQQASQELLARGLDLRAVDDLLRPAHELLRDEVFWYELSEGLGIFIAKDFFETVRLPYEVMEELHISNSFYLLPMVQVITNTEHFYLLVLSKSSAKFYKGGMFGIEQIEVEGLPMGMDDVIHFEEKDKRQLFRGGGTAPGADASFHGHGSGLADEKEYISQYLNEVDQTLWKEVLANERAPLILAGVEYIAAIYRQVSHYKYIADTVITGNYDNADDRSLLERARDIAIPLLKERVNKALQNYYNHIAKALTSSMPNKVIPASHYAQVSDLFVQKHAHIWGNFDSENNKLVLHDTKQDGDECLIDVAIKKTIANGGDVFILDKEKMPRDAVIAAFLRFQ